MAADLFDGQEVTAVGGATLTVSLKSGVMINNANVVAADIEASNGVIHVIDAVLVFPNTIVEVAATAGAFTSLLAAAEIAGLVDTLKSDGPFTVFAPTDEAFADVRNLDTLLADPAALKTLLLNHVVSGVALAEDLSQGQRFTAVGGETLIVYKMANGAVMINDSNVIQANVMADNGVIHVIDEVFEFMREGRVYCPGFPFDDECNCRQDDDCFDHAATRCSCAEAKGATCCNGYMPPKPVLGVAKDAGGFTTLLAAVEAAGLTKILTEDTSVTIFAPTDEAFSRVANLDAIIADREALTKLLKNHVVMRTLLSSALEDGSSILTSGGALLKVKIDGDKVMINNAQVIQADVEAYNGVIHVLDEVLNTDVEESTGNQETVTTAPVSAPTSVAASTAPTNESGAGNGTTSPAATMSYTSSALFCAVVLLFSL